jgi:protein-S-isoprenylcysteine O-methyltransferase Ste14
MADHERMRVLGRATASLIGFFSLLAVVMFLPAGIGWWKGWLFLAVFLLQMGIAAIYIWRTNPDLFIARSRMQKGTKGWDRVVFYVLQVVLLAEFPVAALDDRYHWSSAPAWVIVVGYVLFTSGMVGCFWVLSENKFAEMSVRIQTERGHKVIDTGPYVVVRHPMYVACFLLFPGIALALGSFWALIPASLVSVILVVRTVLEDRTLQRELDGYKEYASRVRYRLIPGLW